MGSKNPRIGREKMRQQPKRFIDLKKQGKKITMLTAYEAFFAQLIDQSNLDAILVGDSLGNVFAGYDNTLPVTMDQMVYHTQTVARATDRITIVADMPFMSYEASIQSAKENAGRLIKDGGAQAVKLEIGKTGLDAAKAIMDMGIPVMGHVGLTPQSVYQQGGWKVQGKTDEDSEKLCETVLQLQEAGVFAIVLELMPATVAEKISSLLQIPTIGIGAGNACDGQILVTQDLLGMTDRALPKFVKQYASLYPTIQSALNQYREDVTSGTFPAKSESF